MFASISKSSIRKFLAVTATAGYVVGATIAPVQAATQGTIGSTSTGSIGVSVTIPSLAQISKLADLTLGSWTGTGALSASNNGICVWSSTGGYSITATSANGAGSVFNVKSGSNVVAYEVQWAQTGGAASGASLNSGGALGGQTTNASSVDCSTGAQTTAGVFVSIPAANLSGKAAGTYTDTLTLLVSPT